MGLRLDAAIQLLQQQGGPALVGAPGSQVWLQGLIDALCDLSSRDPLTGLANRRGFEAVLHRELDRVARSGEPALLLLLEVDHFRALVDMHGHAVGDQVLRAVAQALNDSVRPMDLPARIGGERFVVVLPNCPPAFGLQLAERVRNRVEHTVIAAGPVHQLGVTVSVGGAYAAPWVGTAPPAWLERADLQLCQAKSEGRNRTCLEPTPVTTVSADEKGLLFADWAGEHDA